jgi:hypothetical protein
LAAVQSVVELVAGAEESRVPPVDELFDAARARLDRAAVDAGGNVDELATTLSIVLITEEGVQVGQVGDGIVVVRDQLGGLRAITPAERFEYANETVFLSSETWRDHLRLERLPHSSVSGVALSTDGLRFKILDDLTLGTPYSPFFDDTFAWFDSDAATSDAVARFIDRLDDQSGDDKTLVIASRRTPLASQSEHCVVNRYVSEPAPDAPDAADDADAGTSCVST